MARGGGGIDRVQTDDERELPQSAPHNALISTNNVQDVDKRNKSKIKKRKHDQIDGADVDFPAPSENGTGKERTEKKRSSKAKKDSKGVRKSKKRRVEENDSAMDANGATGELHDLSDNVEKEKDAERRTKKKRTEKTKHSMKTQSVDSDKRKANESDVANTDNITSRGRGDSTKKGKKDKKDKSKNKTMTESDGQEGKKPAGSTVDAEAGKVSYEEKEQPSDTEKRKKDKKSKSKKRISDVLDVAAHSDPVNESKSVKKERGNAAAFTKAETNNHEEKHANGILNTSNVKENGKPTQRAERDESNSERCKQSSAEMSQPSQYKLTGAGKPTTEEIFKRASKKRKVFLHGCAAIPLPSRAHVRALDDVERHKFIKTSASFCERLVYMMHNIIVSANQWMKVERKDDFIAIEDALTNDMARLKKIPLARQYVEMTLWRRILQLNRDHLQAASKVGFGKGIARSEMPQQGLVLHLRDDPDAEFVSYKEAHMTNLVDRFHESLEKMRNIENMDSGQAQFLLRCLDAGSNLFGNLKCLDKKQPEDGSNNLLTLNDNSKEERAKTK